MTTISDKTVGTLGQIFTNFRHHSFSSVFQPPNVVNAVVLLSANTKPNETTLQGFQNKLGTSGVCQPLKNVLLITVVVAISLRQTS